MAFERLRSSLTRGNLWLYVLSELRRGEATPGELRTRVLAQYGFAPAPITFYAVLYKMRREGLVRRSSQSFRSAYSITPRGTAELVRAASYLDETKKKIG